MIRYISNDFLDDLNTGCLKYLTEIVKEDYSLILCFRKNYINIYYKGQSLLRIEQKKKGYECSFNLGHCKELNQESLYNYINTLDTLTGIRTAKSIVSCSVLGIGKVNFGKKYYKFNTSTIISKKYVRKKTFKNIINILKKFIDSYTINNDTIEKKAQQKLFRDNFDSSIENGYIFLDREYEVKKHICPGLKKDANIDGIALKIKNYKVAGIELVEIKSLFSACVGTSGLKEHYNDYDTIIKDRFARFEIVKDLKRILFYYEQLGLLSPFTKSAFDCRNLEFDMLFVFTDEIESKNKLINHLKKYISIYHSNGNKVKETEYSDALTTLTTHITSKRCKYINYKM